MAPASESALVASSFESAAAALAAFEAATAAAAALSCSISCCAAEMTASKPETLLEALFDF